MILLGFWHCCFKSVSLHLPSQAPGQRWITCTHPSCRARAAVCLRMTRGCYETSPRPQPNRAQSCTLTALSASSKPKVTLPMLPSTLRSVMMNADQGEKVSFPSYRRSLWQELVLLASLMQFTLARLPSAQIISTRESRHSYKEVSPKLLLVSLVIQQTQVE